MRYAISLTLATVILACFGIAFLRHELIGYGLGVFSALWLFVLARAIPIEWIEGDE